MSDEMPAAPIEVHLLEERDLSTNALLASYDVSDSADIPAVRSAIEATIPATSCLVLVERSSPLSDLSPLPDAPA